MVIGVGVDIVEISRITRALDKGVSLMRKVFTPEEVSYCSQRKNRYQHFAGRFAAKEAALKALGTGWQNGIRWKDVEVTAGKMGRPELQLHGKASEVFQQSGARQALVTITHSDNYAVAVVIMET